MSGARDTRWWGLLAAMVALGGAAGCGSPAGSPTTGASRTTPRAPTSPRVARYDGCVPLGGATQVVPMRVPGTSLAEGLRIGSGRTGVVLSNESDEDLCAWLPFVRVLRTRGFAVLLYDYGADMSPSPGVVAADALAGVRVLRSRGTRRVVLLGASVGARGTLLAGTRARGASAIVTLSAERTLMSDATDLATAARRVAVLALLIAAREDPYVADDATGALFAAIRSAHKHKLVVPGADHGTSLLDPPQGPRVRARILRFISGPSR